MEPGQRKGIMTENERIQKRIDEIWKQQSLLDNILDKDEYEKKRAQCMVELALLNYRLNMKPDFEELAGLGKGGDGSVIEIPIGIREDKTVVSVNLTDKAYHALILGTTGSGKSVLLHTIILNAMKLYSPEQLQLYLMDFKQGTEFQIYEEFYTPHIKLLAISNRQEFGESILVKLDSEIKKRSGQFKEAGVSGIREYNEKAAGHMPHIICVIDEFQVLFDTNDNRNTAEHCIHLAENIAKQGRSYGIHLIMASQSLRSSGLDGIIDQMNIRIGLNWEPGDTYRLFKTNDTTKLLEMKTDQKGAAVITDSPGMGAEEAFTVLMCKEKDEALEEINSRWEGYPVDKQIFDEKMEYSLADVLDHWDGDECKYFLGKPVKIAPPLSLTPCSGDNYNLLICGHDDRERDELLERRLIYGCLFGALICGDTEVLCADGENIGKRRSLDGTAEVYELLESEDSSAWFKRANNEEELKGFIRKLYESYIRRKAGEECEDNTVFIVRNLQRLSVFINILTGEEPEEELPEEKGSNSGSFVSEIDSILGLTDSAPKGPEEKAFPHKPLCEELRMLLKDGWNYGIFFIVTSQTYKAIRDCSDGYGIRNFAQFFEHKIVYNIKSEDAQRLFDGIDGAASIKTGQMMEGTACYTNGIDEIFTIKPYKEPDMSEIRRNLDMEDE